MVLRISVAVLAFVALVLLFFGTGYRDSAGGQSVVRDLLGLERNSTGVAALDDLGNPLPGLAGGECVSAPGRSALDQYCQSIPDGAGGQSVDSLGDEPTVAEAAPKGTTRRLSDAGQDGDVLAGLPAARGAAEEVSTEAAAESNGEAGRDGRPAPPVTVPSASTRLAIVGTGGEKHLNPGLLIVVVVAAAALLGGIARVRRAR